MDIFEEIMALIEQKGNIPFMMKDVEKWEAESPRNEALLKIFLTTVIRQGEELCEQKNEIKQLNEDKTMLQKELNYRIIKGNRYERVLYDVLKYFDSISEVAKWKNEEKFKTMTINALMYEARKMIKKELDNATNID